jgi:hypothetical protein
VVLVRAAESFYIVRESYTNKFRKTSNSAFTTSNRKFNIKVEEKKYSIMSLVEKKRASRCLEIYKRPYIGERIEEDSSKFNIFDGFQAQLVDEVDMERVQPLLDYVRVNWCSHKDKNCTMEEKFRFVMNLLAYPFYNINNCLRSEILTILIGEAGTGKTMLLERFAGMIYGVDKSHICRNMEDLVGKFNADMEGCPLVLVDELENYRSKNNQISYEQIKSYVTGAFVKIEGKGKDRRQAENVANIWFTTNNDNPVRMGKGEARRFFVLRTPNHNKNNKKYWKKMNEYFNDQTNMNHVFTYLHRYPEELRIDTKGDEDGIPKTDDFLRLLEEFMSPEQQFINAVKKKEHKFMQQSMQKTPTGIWYLSTEDLHLEFSRFCEQNEICVDGLGENSHKNKFMRNKDINSFFESIKVKISGKDTRQRKIPEEVIQNDTEDEDEEEE